MEQFIVKHYTADDRPSIKGNGFDGLEIGEDREEAEEFINYVNEIISSLVNLLKLNLESDIATFEWAELQEKLKKCRDSLAVRDQNCKRSF